MKIDYDAFARWLKDTRPDVIVSLDAEFLERVLQDLGWCIPRDIGIASLGCTELGDRLSGICQLGRLKGATAIDVLAGLMELNNRGLPERPVTTLVEGRWNPGNTLKTVAGTPSVFVGKGL